MEGHASDEIVRIFEEVVIVEEDEEGEFYAEDMFWDLDMFDAYSSGSRPKKDYQQEEHLLKPDLVKYLERIITLSYLLKFWDLVESAANLLNPLEVPLENDTDEDDNLDLDKIFEKLKEIVAPKKVALMIGELVNFKEDALDLPKEFVSIVSEIDEVSQENCEDYLKRLTSITKTLITSIRTLKYSSKFVDFYEYKTRLASLRPYFIRHRNNVTEEMLLVMFQIGIKKLDFTVEEKNEIGNLLVEAFGAIKGCIVHILYVMSRMRSKYLKFRSALQFFIEVCVKLPSSDKTVGQVVDMADIMNCIKFLEDLISDLWEDHIPDSDNSDFEDASEVPESHVWWPKNGMNGFICLE